MDREEKLRTAQNLSNTGLDQVRNGSYSEALGNFRKSLTFFEELDETLSMAFQWGNIGSVCRDTNQLGEAIEAYQSALTLFEGIDHAEGIADQYANIAYIKVLQEDIDEALSCYKKALPSYAKTACYQKQLHTQQNIANIEARLKGAS